MNLGETIEFYTNASIKMYMLWNRAVKQRLPIELNEIDRLLAKTLKKSIAINIPLQMFRARIIDGNDYVKIKLKDVKQIFSRDSGIYGFGANEMGAPPSQFATNGRANKETESHLYLASNKETACAEVQPVCGNLISVATFNLTDGLQLVDFRSLPTEFNSFTNKDESEKLVDIVFFESVVDFFSHPARKGNETVYEYSQYIAAWLKEKGIQGILYNSSHNESAFNLVLFDPKKAKCISDYGDVFRCLSSVAKFQSVSKNYTRENLEVLETRVEQEPYLWNRTLLLYRDIKNIQNWSDANDD